MQKGFIETISAAEPSSSTTTSATTNEQERGSFAIDRGAIIPKRGDSESITLNSSTDDDYDCNEHCHDYANITRLLGSKRDRTKVELGPHTDQLSGLLLSTRDTNNSKKNQDHATGKSVVNYVICKQQQSTGHNNKTNKIQQNIQKVDLATASDYCHTTGENSRCNCSGRRRATLAGLVELFEQKVLIEEPELAKDSKPTVVASEARLPLKPESRAAAAATTISNLTVNKVNNHNKSNMRNIITPVKYQLSETDDGDEEDDEEVVDDEQEQESAWLTGNGSGLARAALHRVAIKGVPVLPQPESRKLTKTNWQPATDGRRYEQLTGAGQCQRATSKLDEQQSASSSNCLQSSMRKHCRALSSSSLAATRGPPIVKHQMSSSRRLLNQLARLRRLSEPNYRIKRPEKVEQVESLIDQLERATIEWEEDDQLLDRAERRDWPQQYHERYSQPSHQVSEQPKVDSQISIDFGRRDDVHSLEEDAIARSHSIFNIHQVSPEMDQHQQQPARVRYTAAGPWTSSLGRPNRRLQPPAFADRYHDDLAVRRLSSKSPTASHSRLGLVSDQTNEMQVNFSSAHQLSYLLCSNAYTPTIEGADWDAVDRQVRNDDLHYRNIKNKPDPYEPPFGIPRQPSLAGTHSSASHYLRYPTNNVSASPSPICTCSCACDRHQMLQHRQTTHKKNDYTPRKRADSRVSFLEHFPTSDRTRWYSGCNSADSGVVGGDTPLSMGERQSTSSRLTPNSPQNSAHFESKAQSGLTTDCCNQQQSDFEYVDTEEVDLNLELKKTDQDKFDDSTDKWSPCQSPALERYKAEIRATPVKRRPRINFENPRAKSPLLRTSKKPVVPAKKLSKSNGVVQVQCYQDTIESSSTMRNSTSEFECRLNFDDDNEEWEERPRARRILTTNLDSSDSSPNESSIDRYNYRGDKKVINTISNTMRVHTRRDDNEKPLFSIGEYKPLNKPNLKIL